MQDLLTALALVLVIEGVLYAAFPSGMRRALESGLVAAAIGVAAVWLVRG